MSDSRLEKFIYAICSMDVSDLPVPLSRIEKLWNCLITGETPDFEPLSRNEKYLMAMLDRYDISNLPAPMSRGEKLLYKIAMGETDLSDVPGYLSRYEELLKYLIENGGISGGDFEYVLYTLNQSLSTLYSTAEKPVKRAILTGKTINNLWTNSRQFAFVQEKTDDTTIKFYSEQYDRITFGKTQKTTATTVGIKTSQRLQANKTYHINTFVFDALDVTDSFLIRDNSNGINLTTLKIEGYPPGQILSFTTQVETNNLIFYYLAHSRTYGAVNYGKPFYMPKRFIISDKLEDVVNQEFFEGMQSVKMPVLTTSNEDGTKTIILTVNEEVELRGIGEGSNRVEDELDCLTGELTQKVENVLLTGDEVIELWYTTSTEHLRFYVQCDGVKKAECVCNKLTNFQSQTSVNSNFESIAAIENGFSIVILKNRLNEESVNGIKQWIRDNSVSITYQLEQEVNKTVDLTVVNQDNQPTQLGTFENVTHVSLEAENLIPEVELEVATRISEELTSASPLMDDISTEQQQLNTTIDEQSENVDATMIATTEIFEETL